MPASLLSSIREQLELTIRIIVFGVIGAILLPIVLGALLDFVDWVRGNWHDYTHGRD